MKTKNNFYCKKRHFYSYTYILRGCISDTLSYTEPIAFHRYLLLIFLFKYKKSLTEQVMFNELSINIKKHNTLKKNTLQVFSELFTEKYQ